jgi:hypothetical protein
MSTGAPPSLINYDVVNAYYDSITELHIYQVLFFATLAWALCCSCLVCAVCLRYRSVNNRYAEGLVTPAEVQRRHELKPLVSTRGR